MRFVVKGQNEESSERVVMAALSVEAGNLLLRFDGSPAAVLAFDGETASGVTEAIREAADRILHQGSVPIRFAVAGKEANPERVVEAELEAAGNSLHLYLNGLYAASLAVDYHASTCIDGAIQARLSDLAEKGGIK